MPLTLHLLKCAWRPIKLYLTGTLYVYLGGISPWLSVTLCVLYLACPCSSTTRHPMPCGYYLYYNWGSFSVLRRYIVPLVRVLVRFLRRLTLLPTYMHVRLLLYFIPLVSGATSARLPVCGCSVCGQLHCAILIIVLYYVLTCSFFRVSLFLLYF